jgi:hypothetical protein
MCRKKVRSTGNRAQQCQPTAPQAKLADRISLGSEPTAEAMTEVVAGVDPGNPNQHVPPRFQDDRRHDRERPWPGVRLQPQTPIATIGVPTGASISPSNCDPRSKRAAGAQVPAKRRVGDSGIAGRSEAQKRKGG